jgi:hypothetical protein
MNIINKLAGLFFLIAISTVSIAQDSLKKNFLSPPNSAKPRVWWHWMNGNVTKEGIKKDLDWMEKTGIGGFQNFDANLFTPDIVPNKLVFMTPEWKDAFKFTTDLAIEKNLEMAIAGSPGWSVTGGPWVAPQDGMKKYVWSEVLLKGGQTFNGKIPQPSDISGPFLNIEMTGESFLGGGVKDLPKFYKDSYLVAYKLPDAEKHLPDLKPKITVSGGAFDVNKLLDHDIKEHFEIPPMAIGEDMYIQYTFDVPQTFKAFGIAGASDDPMAQFNGLPLNRSLKVSDDGINFREIARVSGSYVPFNTVSIPTTTAKYWRMSFETLKPVLSPIMQMMGINKAEPQGVKVAEFVLFNTNRIDQWEDKAGFTPWTEQGLNKGIISDDVIKLDYIIDLTSKMQADGRLKWDVPAGEWMILRMGYSLTGRQNHPASPEATGLEVDKLDKNAVRKYINTYLDMYQDATGNQMGAKGLEYMILDSYEAGHMNWTHDFPQQFENKRGYSILKWLPVLTGRVVKSVVESEKFLWDFRKTIGEMIVENHYDVIGEELNKRGMKRYTESHENKRIYLADGMDVKRHSEIPMAAMWTPGSLAGGEDEEPRSEGDIREAASVANIYGKPFVAAESMTSVGKAFQEYPEKLKRTADLELASGLNRFVIHTSVHQPLDIGPGFSLGPFGQYFSRLETWSGAGAKAWIGYLGRSSYMMQQGRNVADILYLYGENTNITWVCRESLPNIPEGLEFDFVNASILKTDIQAKEGSLVAPSGNKYKVLVLDESAKEMTLGVLRKIKALQDAGIKVVGQKPIMSPSLSDDSKEFQRIATEVASRMTNLNKVDLTPDVIINGTDHKILFRHRASADTDIYWLNNRNVEPTEASVSFKIAGKIPEIWNPKTGESKEVAFEVKDDRTIISLDFESWDAYFIVFKESTTITSYDFVSTRFLSSNTISGPWNVDFKGKKETYKDLVSWTESEEMDIKYFSGTAHYSTTFNMETLNSRASYEIDLGDVKNIAEIILNGKNVGTVWKTPFKLDVSDAIKKGENQLEIRVTNTWANRLIGDAQPDVKVKSTFTSMALIRPNMPLMPAGIIGEVKIITMQ